MNLIQRELKEAVFDYQLARENLRDANYLYLPAEKEVKRISLSELNRSRARLKNVIRAANVLLGRA